MVRKPSSFTSFFLRYRRSKSYDLVGSVYHGWRSWHTRFGLITRQRSRNHNYTPRPLPFKCPIYFLRGFLHVFRPQLMSTFKLSQDTPADLLFVRIGYIGEFEEVDDHRSGKIVIQLNGRYDDQVLSAR